MLVSFRARSYLNRKTETGKLPATDLVEVHNAVVALF